MAVELKFGLFAGLWSVDNAELCNAERKIVTIAVGICVIILSYVRVKWLLSKTFF